MGSLTIPPGGQITNLTQGGPTRPPVGSQGPMPMTLGNATQGTGGGMRSGGLSTFQTPLPSVPGMSNMTPQASTQAVCRSRVCLVRAALTMVLSLEIHMVHFSTLGCPK